MSAGNDREFIDHLQAKDKESKYLVWETIFTGTASELRDFILQHPDLENRKIKIEEEEK